MEHFIWRHSNDIPEVKWKELYLRDFYMKLSAKDNVILWMYSNEVLKTVVVYTQPLERAQLRFNASVL